MDSHSHFQKIFRTNMVVAQVDNPRIIRPIITQLVERHFNSDPEAFSEWYYQFYMKHEHHEKRGAPQNIVGNRFTTAANLLKLYRLQLQMIQKTLHQSSIPATLQYAKQHLNNVPVPYDVTSNKIDIYHCALNAKRSINSLIEMMPNDWCWGNNKNVTLVNLCIAWIVKILLEHHVNSFHTAIILLTHYTETHSNEILKKYGPYANLHK